MYKPIVVAWIALAACGDNRGAPIDAANPDSGIDAAAIDAAPIDAAPIDAAPIDAAPIDAVPIDAPPSPVVEVPCGGAIIASTVTAPGFAFNLTAASIPTGAVAQFIMPGFHNAVSGTVAGGAMPDGRFLVDFGQTRCLRFTGAGTYPFYCAPHLFTATLTVTP